MMISSTSTTIDDVVLFYAGQSLLEQITEWEHDNGRISLSLASLSSTIGVRNATRAAATIVIDATVCPREAMLVLQHTLTTLPSEIIAVYTEKVHNGLELFVRVRGVMLLLGPMSLSEWDGFFAKRLSTVMRRTIPFDPGVYEHSTAPINDPGHPFRIG